MSEGRFKSVQFRPAGITKLMAKYQPPRRLLVALLPGLEIALEYAKAQVTAIEREIRSITEQIQQADETQDAPIVAVPNSASKPVKKGKGGGTWTPERRALMSKFMSERNKKRWAAQRKAAKAKKGATTTA